jgi:hypothetical protein
MSMRTKRRGSFITVYVHTFGDVDRRIASLVFIPLICHTGYPENLLNYEQSNSNKVAVPIISTVPSCG